MDQTETLELYRQGRDAWNEWAEDLVVRREGLGLSTYDRLATADFTGYVFDPDCNFRGFVFPGITYFRGATFSDNVRFDDATFSGHAWFDKATFSGEARFDNSMFGAMAFFAEADFSGTARLTSARFSHEARFDRVTFRGLVSFDASIFSGESRFRGATFSRDARFDNVRFSANTWFVEASFLRNASFRQSCFNGPTTFARACFEAGAEFPATVVSSSFLLSDVQFKEVPNFDQAQFVQAPRLDNFTIRSSGFRDEARIAIRTLRNGGLASASIRKALRRFVKRRRARAARWSELKRLAIQRHNHQCELLFFARELRARRFSADKPWHIRFWVGIGYGWFSDYGASVTRPLLSWVGGVALSVWVILHVHSARSTDPPMSDAGFSCIVGNGDPLYAAVSLSLQKALFAASLSKSKLDKIHACLFGIEDIHADVFDLPTKLQPVYPDLITLLGFAEFVWSAVMLFLLALALRNYFRIR